MFIRTWSKGGKLYASVVRSVREGKKVSQKTVVYLGAIEESQLPYLQAAYSKKKPALLYDDGRIYRP